MSKTTTSNSFLDMMSETNSTTASRTLEFTPELNGRARKALTDFMHGMKDQVGTDLAAKANKIADGDPALCMEVLTELLGQARLDDDADAIRAASVDELERMLESHRSNRTKAKKKGLTTDGKHLMAYMVAIWAEMVIRAVLGKPYKQPSNLDNFDAQSASADELKKKIASLSSKCSRLRLTAPYVEADAVALEKTENELANLRAMRPGSTGKKSSKSLELKTALAALQQIKDAGIELPEGLSPDLLAMLK